MEMAISKAKATGRDLHYGICGEHGGDPVSVEFCHKIGLDYVSCSPFRVPIARRPLSKLGRPNLHFDFSIDYEEALKYRQANGQYLRRNQWQDLTVQVYI